MVPLKIAAYCAYLASWLVFAVVSLMGAMPRQGGEAEPKGKAGMTVPELIGTVLQVLAAVATTSSMARGPLRGGAFELGGALVLAPLGAALFVWAQRSAPRDAGEGQLVTGGAYAWVRHPIYLAFFAMLVATGLLISGGVRMILPVVLYVGGTELRIAEEERELAVRFGDGYGRYRGRTRWRYLPGLR